MSNQPLTITSPANPKIKWLVSLHKHANRRREGVVIVEGNKEINFALDAGLRLEELFIVKELSDNNLLPGAEKNFLISKTCFEKAAYRANSDGLIGIFAEPRRSLSSLQLSKAPFIIILEAVEKPGNLGAIIRTADGASADAVIVCDERCDIWNPNAIRASVGTIFSTPVFTATKEIVAAFLKEKSIQPFAAALTKNAIPYTSTSFKGPAAIIFGTEANGLSDFWLAHTTNIIIPMHGKNDSLNVSVAAGVLAYEVVRQRTNTR
ncbi:MAG TPA: TrmH family RNA methyltransferase [Candidatus Saccharimonadales bacterium]